MTIGIVGLGLIGGSMAKAIKTHTTHQVIGYDRDTLVLDMALESGAIDAVGNSALLSQVDLLLLALYPNDIISFVEEHAKLIKKGSIVVDLCGVKRVICDTLNKVSHEHGFTFIGGHPMAGRELSGFSSAVPDLFYSASMILTPPDDTNDVHMEALCEFFKTLRFSKVVCTTPDNHDRMIAFTSQLAHVVSSAYIKSPEASVHAGYSAGSYKDLTRVAKLNEVMWTELFLHNRLPLLEEIDTIIMHLSEYRTAIAKNDAQTLQSLLKDGRIRKESIDQNELI